MEVGGDVCDAWKRVVVWFHHHVEASTITAGAQGTVLFSDDVERVGPRAGGLLTDAHCLHVVEDLLSS